MTIPYDPATPLRTDATDEQIYERQYWLTVESDGMPAVVVREFAAAVKAATVAEYEAKLAALEAYNAAFRLAVKCCHVGGCEHHPECTCPDPDAARATQPEPTNDR